MQAAGRLGAKKNEKNEENAELNCGSMFSLFFALTFFPCIFSALSGHSSPMSFPECSQYVPFSLKMFMSFFSIVLL